MSKPKPDIRAITRLVPPSGNLVQGQSELPIDGRLARAASEQIAMSRNHYGASEGTEELRAAVAEKIARFNGIVVDPRVLPPMVLVTNGATGGLIAIAHTYLKGASALVFEPYYPYHRRIVEECGGSTKVFPLRGENLQLDGRELRDVCRRLVRQTVHPLRAIIVCSPANPTGRIFSRTELESIAAVCQEFDLLCIADEVYEHFVVDEKAHVSMASLPGMFERTITVNSFSKSWNISGWRLGYLYGPGKLVGPLNNANNVFYVCAATPLQRALATVLMDDPEDYARLRVQFIDKRERVSSRLRDMGFEIFGSGSSFYLWTRIPEGLGDAMQLNESLIRHAGVAGVPGCGFAEGKEWDHYMRWCIAREDHILDSALSQLEQAISLRRE